MFLSPWKNYRCEISASGKTMEVNTITDEGLERKKCVLRLSGHDDLVAQYKSVVSKRNRHLETEIEDRDEVWDFQSTTMATGNSKYGRFRPMKSMETPLGLWVEECL